ncbi:MAG: hypothetical protein E7329_11980 [Clostridiales bacterium]|nr:hypothetical protein [Clostridiales bacterium]
MKKEEFAKLLQQDAQNTPLPPVLRKRTLNAIDGKENPIVKKKISVSLAVALAMLLICSVALAVATQAGILDFAGRYAGSYVPENAADYVQKGEIILENEVFTATLREQYYDGRVARLIMDFTPKGDQVLFIGADNWGDDSWQDLISLNYADMDQTDKRSIQDVMSEYQAAYQCGFIAIAAENDRDLGGTGDYFLNPETGVLTVYDQTEFAENKENREVTIRASAFPAYIQEGEFILDWENAVRSEIVLPLAAVIPETKAYESVEPVVFSSIGVQVDRLLIEVKPQEIFATLDFSIIDEEAYAKLKDGLWFEFIDPNSTETEAWKQQLASGLTGSAGVSTVSDGKFQQHETLGLNELHDTYTLRAYSEWTKERFETHELVMKPVE